MKTVSLIILVLVTLVACSPAAAPEESGVASLTAPSPTALPSETPTRAPTATPPPVADSSSPQSPLPKPTEIDGRRAEFPNTIVVYRLDSQEWTIYVTGRILGGDGTAWEVPADQMIPLLESVEADGFWELEEVYGSAETCPECPLQTLTVYRGGDVKIITVRQEPKTLPRPLASALGSIENLIVLK